MKDEPTVSDKLQHKFDHFPSDDSEVTGVPLQVHGWPSDEGHLFGPWHTQDRTTIYRVCIHPDCTLVERKGHIPNFYELDEHQFFKENNDGD